MPALPTRFAPVIVPFAGLFRQPTWRHARALLLGAILAPGVRTVASVLRVLGRARERRFCRYHRVLSRATWSPLAASRILLGLLVRAFVPTGPLVVGIDETVERRRGKRIRAKGIYRDAVRSSQSHFVKASGLRWLSVMLPRADSVGGPYLGAAVPHGTLAFASLQRRSRAPPQEADGLGAATAPASAPVGTRTRARHGRRLELRCPRPSRRTRAANDLHHPIAPRRAALRPGPAAPPRNERPPAPEGRAHALAARRPHRCHDQLATRDRRRLVRRGDARHRTGDGDRRVAPPRAARSCRSGGCSCAIRSAVSIPRRSSRPIPR